jgi:uncharacterized membrane protein
MDRFIVFRDFLKQHYNFEIRYKDKSFFMKFLSFILFFNKTFMTNYATTIGSIIYYPSEEYIKNNEDSSISILAHEIVHVKQKNTYGSLFFSILYLFPQVLAVFSLLSIFLSWWYLLFLLFLLPLPAPFRKDFEKSAYTMSLFIMWLKLNNINATQEYIDDFFDNFVLLKESKFKTADYWFMWPFGVSFKNDITKIKSGVISERLGIYAIVKTAYSNLYGVNNGNNK